MTDGLRILQGSWKGKKIPIPSKVKGNLQFTPSLIKKSVFGRIQSWILGDEIDPSSAYFIDLFSGSGQIGMEALSLGFDNVVFFELDKSRFSELIYTYQELSKANLLDNRVQFYHKDGFRYYSQWKGFEESNELLFYLDPPYSFWDSIQPKLLGLIDNIRNLQSNSRKVFILVQTSEDNILKDMERVEFGNNSIFFWKSIG